MKPVIVLSYAGCSTCKKALAWLRGRGVEAVVRPIVEEPPTKRELSQWIPASGLPLRKWLNTSGQSYRTIGKDAIANASDNELVERLTKDGKLVKRPVLVTRDRVLIGFDPEAYAVLFGRHEA